MLLLALVLAVADPVQGSVSGKTVTVAPNAPSDPDRPKVAQAAELIRAHRETEAMPLLDAVIASEQQRNAAEKRRIYCSRALTETLMYMGMAARDKTSAVALDSTWCEALYMRGFVEVDLGQQDKAEADYKRAVELAPMNAHFLGELGELYKSRKDWAQAKIYFDRAAEAAPLAAPELKNAEQRRAWRGQAYVLTEYRKLDEAEALYRKVLALDPTDEHARHELDYIAGLRRQAAKTTS